MPKKERDFNEIFLEERRKSFLEKASQESIQVYNRIEEGLKKLGVEEYRIEFALGQLRNALLYIDNIGYKIIKK